MPIIYFVSEAPLWWFGFDCGHAGDLVPELAKQFPLIAELGGVYRDRDYVVGETCRMAAQLRRIHQAAQN
jgi:hypothetical protein